MNGGWDYARGLTNVRTIKKAPISRGRLHEPLNYCESSRGAKVYFFFLAGAFLAAFFAAFLVAFFID